MKLTVEQVADILHVSGTTVRTMAVNKILPAINNSNPNSKRKSWRFESKDINAYKKVNKINGKPTKIEKSNPSGIMTKLSNIENNLSKLDNKIEKLIKLWE